MSKQLIQQYRANRDRLIRFGGSHNESVLRKAFQALLDHYARSKNLLIVPEVEYPTNKGNKVYPDGTLKDGMRLSWGFWESKDEDDVLEDEIAEKFAKGYPDSNILFEDSTRAILYQNGDLVMTANFEDSIAFDAILTLFVNYEPREVKEFHKAIEQFNTDVPELAKTLREIIDEQYEINTKFKQSLNEFLELCKKAINPKVEMADVREMIIQHILTEDIFMRVFDEADFHRDNVIARELQAVAGTFYKGATKHNIEDRIKHYYETINARASQISDHHEKQKFLKALYENFYRAYNPKAADRLGVIYTPDEIVHFMIESTEYLLDKHFGRTLGDQYVDILDPATGTGTFITELIEYLPPNQLDMKYDTEIHCNEVAILPYYIANLNIEFTYKQKTGKYKEFENICFVDTLDNMGFTRSSGHQPTLFNLSDENVVRINRQNKSNISVVIGNPPYYANQASENENNKSRKYPEIDKRIKETYIKYSSAQKTKNYDMYMRFIRWASDRLAQDGIIAFVSNNSFIDADSNDGLRKVLAKEFNNIYVINLKGDARSSGEKRKREGGNIFSNKIREGIAVYFLVKKEKEKGCHIYYNEVYDAATAEEKKAYLRDNRFEDLVFKPIIPDKMGNWVGQGVNWSSLAELGNKETRESIFGQKSKTIFKFFSLGVSTNRDEWVYDPDIELLKKKVRFFIDEYNSQVVTLKGVKVEEIDSKVKYSIKWSEALKRNAMQGKIFTFDENLIIRIGYRPYTDLFYYSEKNMSDRLTANHFRIFGRNLKHENHVIAVNTSSGAFSALASNHILDLHFNGDTVFFPLYCYTPDGERVENVTDWAQDEFVKHYKNDKRITREAIFNYVYAVLHNPVYRSKYELNLKKEFPRIPFYKNFWRWADWGKELMQLHINYEFATPINHNREDKNQDSMRIPIRPRLISRKERGSIEIDTQTTITNIPVTAWEYRIGTYSALDWVLERHKEKTSKDEAIAAKFNTYRFSKNKEHVIDLLMRICTVSIETMKIINQMPDTDDTII